MQTCAKRCYESEREARLARDIQLRRPKPPDNLRIYWCDDCSAFHLTKQTVEENQRQFQTRKAPKRFAEPPKPRTAQVVELAALWVVTAANPHRGIAHLVIDGHVKPVCGRAMGDTMMANGNHRCEKCAKEKDRLKL